ncbi:MAG: PD-(D/E)XK nuclease domain-containing protein, partial [Lachnospiraceae bacterium]|nr:PD-(D/E)XK nuclease domain-containing protein [Lachnospiraceae bacterium]
YNPWSIASFIYRGGEYDTYWADTSGNGLVNSLIRQGNVTVKSAMEDLLAGKTLTTELNEQIVFNQLDGSSSAVWSLLLATGYLKVVKLERVGERKKKVYTLALTNMETASMFEDMVKGWFGGENESAYNDFIKALLINDVEAMNEFMNEIALLSFSSFDTAKSASMKDAPERFYHGFVLGLMVGLEGRFQITSNRESGFGRYDIMLIPKDREKDCAYIIEFKVHKPLKEKDLEETVANALNQIEEKLYEAKLVAEGFAPENIRKYGFAFRGKECLIGC